MEYFYFVYISRQSSLFVTAMHCKTQPLWDGVLPNRECQSVVITVTRNQHGGYVEWYDCKKNNKLSVEIGCSSGGACEQIFRLLF